MDDDQDAVDDPKSGKAEMVNEFRKEGWVENTTVEDGIVKVGFSEAPDLRAVYDVIERTGGDQGTVNVEGDDQTWEITYEGSEVVNIERVSGEYTVLRMSRIEQVFMVLNNLGVFTMVAAVITGVAGFFMETPLSLLESGVVFGVGLGLFIIGGFLFEVAPGMTHGPRPGTPGEGIPDFEELSPHDQAALIAVDDAKSKRNYSDLLRQRRTLPTLIAFGFIAYLGVLGFINFGATGVIGVGILLSLRIAYGFLIAVLIGSGFDTLEDSYVEELFDEIHEDENRPKVVKYGDEENPIHENTALAIPEMNVIAMPIADVEKLHRDELKAILAHEYKHAQSHYHMTLGVVKIFLMLLPGIFLLVSGVSPSLLELGVGLFAYFSAMNASISLVSRKWEREADDFAAEVASPMGMVFGLNRLTSRQIIDDNDESLVSTSTSEMYGSHPVPHRRIARMIERETE